MLRQSVNVLLEGTPEGLDMHAVEHCVRDVAGVCGVHHLHVWTVGSGMVAASLHVVVEEQSVSSSQQVLKAIAATLKSRYQINHATVQVETEGCPGGGDCGEHAVHAHSHDHDHTHHHTPGLSAPDSSL